MEMEERTPEVENCTMCTSPLLQPQKKTLCNLGCHVEDVIGEVPTNRNSGVQLSTE